MRLSITLLLIIAVLLSIAISPGAGRRKQRRPRSRWDHELEFYPDIDSHFCITKYKVKKLGYPDGCEEEWCNRWWCWWITSCCYQPVYKIVEAEREVCCSGYWGKNCDRPFCSKSCPDGETCVAPNTCGPVVLCEGRCLNGGTCAGLEKCTCTPGYTGTYCESSVADACDPPCLNGGVCEQGQCICPEPFSGPACDKLGFQCNPECQNGGTCIGMDKCQCLSAYTGTFCETPLEGCDPPCLNGGTCVKNKCQCPEDFTGEACEVLSMSDFEP